MEPGIDQPPPPETNDVLVNPPTPDKDFDPAGQPSPEPEVLDEACCQQLIQINDELFISPHSILSVRFVEPNAVTDDHHAQVEYELAGQHGSDVLTDTGVDAIARELSAPSLKSAYADWIKKS